MNVKRLSACSALLAAVGFSTAIAAPSQGTMVVSPATPLSSGDVTTGPLALTQPLHVVIGLRLRNKSELDAFLANPRHAILTPTQFIARYSPASTEAQAVEAFLSRSGFHNVTIASNRLLVSADGTAAEAAAAFKTSFIRVRTHDGREAYANSTNVQIPVALQSSVQAVLGLQNVHVMHTLSRLTRASTTLSTCDPDKVTSCQVGHDPTQFAAIYDATGLPMASAVPVGIITEGSMTHVIQDLNTFTSRHGMSAIPTEVVGPGSSDTSGDAEWDLDSQSIVGISGGVQKFVFYAASSLTDSALTNAYNLAVSSNAVKVINVSIGGCETFVRQDGSAAADDNIFEEAIAQGQTFSVAAGDTGATGYQCPAGSLIPDWPASSQYVVAVGGTSLFTSVESSTQRVKETVWNDGTSSATGGSPSTFEPMPIWQQGVGQNVGHSTRGVPDIAFDADPSSGAIVIVDGQNEQIGGTSLASPLFVGAWASMLQGKGTNLGFAAPLLYRAAKASYASDFHDITIGNNNGETAASGWDYTTGFGSIAWDSAASDILSDLNDGHCETLNDVNGDGKSDLLWRSNDNTKFAYWIMSGTTLVSSSEFTVPAKYKILATGDFNGDGHMDIVWTDGTNMWMWVGNGSTFTSENMHPYPAGWSLVCATDVNGDSKTDLLWLNGANTLSTWLMNGPNFTATYSQAMTPGWWFLTAGDFDGDGRADILWTNGSAMEMWVDFSNGVYTSVATHSYPPNWRLLSAGDVNGDGKADLLWRDFAHQRFAYWIMNGPTLLNSQAINVSSQWHFGTTGDFAGNGLLGIVWYNASEIDMWPGSATGNFQGVIIHSYPSAWTLLP